MKFHISSLQDTRALAEKIAAILQKGDVIALYGNLGVGKTTFARFLIQFLVPDIVEVPSPTFNLVQVYDVPLFPLWHFDFYRLEEPEEIMEIGFEEALVSGVSLIEWPEKIGRYLPSDRIELYFTSSDTSENAREVEIVFKGKKYAGKNI